MTAKPTELAITLAALAGRYGSADGWRAADEIRGQLIVFGFECSTQQVAAWLGRMARTDGPWVEVRKGPWGLENEYRVTRYGITDIENRIPKVKVYVTYR